MPNGVRLGTSVDFSGIAVGAEVTVGASRVLVGPLDVRITRTWDSRVPVCRFAPARVRELAESAAGAEQGVPVAAVAALRTALAVLSQRQPLADAVRGLVGLGQGSTPGGDDVLAGVLAGLHATGATPLVPLIAARLERLPLRTTTLSADLLGLAVRGHACIEALAVLRAAIRPAGGAEMDRTYSTAVRRLLSIGHTSGADLATGMAIGLSVGASSEQRVAASSPLPLITTRTASPASAACQGSS